MLHSESLIAKIYFPKIPSFERSLQILSLSADYYFWRLTLLTMKLNFSRQVFPYWEDGGDSPPSPPPPKPPTALPESFFHFPQPSKMPPIKFLFPPTKWQFSCYNPIKTLFLAVVVVPVRAYSRNLGQCSILARSSTFLFLKKKKTFLEKEFKNLQPSPLLNPFSKYFESK